MSRVEIKSEITGKVWKIEATPGTELSDDEPILILESMKMEIPIAAPWPCRVIELRVAEEDSVAEDQVVAVVEKL